MHPVSRAVLVGTLSVVSVVAAAACQRRGEHEGPRHAGDADHDRDRDRVRDNDIDAGAPVGARLAPRKIAGARCEREARCNNIGADKKWATNDTCEDSIRAEWAQDLNVYDCPSGVKDNELDECLAAIRDEDCNSPFDTLGRISECTAAQICAD